MKFKRLASIFALAAVATLGLTACSGITEEHVRASEHKMIQTDSWKDHWEYENSSGDRQELFECSDRGWFDSSCVETPDKHVRFEYSNYKGSITPEKLTVSGEDFEAECTNTDDGWGDHICGNKHNSENTQ